MQSYQCDMGDNLQVIDTLLSKVVKDFSSLLVSQGNQVLHRLMCIAAYMRFLTSQFAIIQHFPFPYKGFLKYTFFNNFLQLGLFLKKILKGDIGCLSKREFIEAISLYLNQRSSLASNDFSKFCNCGGKRDSIRQNANYSAKYVEVINTQQKQLEVQIGQQALLLFLVVTFTYQFRLSFQHHVLRVFSGFRV